MDEVELLGWTATVPDKVYSVEARSGDYYICYDTFDGCFELSFEPRSFRDVEYESDRFWELSDALEEVDLTR